jgi:hypothetical protein
MPWCPNCNAEYQDGYTECSDCGVALVDSIEEDIELVPFFQAEDKKIAEKLVSYLKYSNMPSEMSYSEENEVYLVNIPPRMEKEARKLYQAFYYVERENIANDKTNSDQTEDPMVEELVEDVEPLHSEEGETEDHLDLAEVAEDEGLEKGPYVFKADRYKDLAGTVGIFLFFGVVGLVFVILNMAGILTILNGWLPNVIMGALFLSFLYVAFSTRQKAQKIRDEIAVENKLTDDINVWLKGNVTKDYLATIHSDSISEELNYIKMTDTIKELLIKNFGKQNLSYLDRLVEEYYNNNF